MTFRERRHLRMLAKRRDFLRARIAANPGKTMSWDRQELAALTWALWKVQQPPERP